MNAAVPLPDPPYPADIKAKGWRFQLDYERIEQSDTWSLANEIPGAQAALLMLWLTAWRQTPCGTLPDDVASIRARLRIPAEVWEASRDLLLRGWYLASDGRLYHPTITELVLEMMGQRRSDAERVARWREAQAAKKAAADVTRNTRITNAGPTPESGVSTTPEPEPSNTYPLASLGGGENPEPTTQSAPSSPSSADPPAGAPPTPDQPSHAAKAKARATGVPPCPYQAIVALYHEVLPELPSVRVVDPAREKAMRRVWTWVFTSTKENGERRATSADEALAWFRVFFGLVRGSDWLMGRSKRTPGHESWECSLDFLMSPKGHKHVIERL